MLDEPRQTLAMRDEITTQLILDRDTRLQGWLYLDWAKAYKLVGEIEQCIVELRELQRRCTVMGSPHALSQVHKMLVTLKRDGYGEVQAVKDFQEEIQEAADQR